MRPFTGGSRSVWLAVLLFLAAVRPSFAETPSIVQAPFSEVHLDSFFTAVQGPGSFVLLDTNRDTLLIHNPARARRRFIPASTFKIPNTLIALETGVADGPDFAIAWDTTRVAPEPYWPKSWRRDQTLRTAFQNSVFWYYQQIARWIGPSRLQDYVDRWGYGNRKLTPAVDTFWLYGDLRISPLEQVDFLARFCAGELGVSDRTAGVVKEIMVLERTDRYVLRGKTGTAEVTPTRELGWLVGYLERGSTVYPFALNMEGERVWEEWPPRKRKALVIRLMKALGVIE